MSHIGKQLTYFRVKRGLKVSECAAALSVSQSTYRDWENGRSIRGEPYKKMAVLFKISLSELFAEEEVELSKSLMELENSLMVLLNQVKSIRSGL